MSFMLRDFHRPRRWLVAWLCLIALVVFVSLLPARDLPPPPFDGVDKLEHLLAYAAMAAGAVMVFVGARTHALLALGLVVLGIGLEFAQGAMTMSRMADGWDAIANTAGVALGWSLRFTPAHRALLWLDARLWGGRGAPRP